MHEWPSRLDAVVSLLDRPSASRSIGWGFECVSGQAQCVKWGVRRNQTPQKVKYLLVSMGALLIHILYLAGSTQNEYRLGFWAWRTVDDRDVARIWLRGGFCAPSFIIISNSARPKKLTSFFVGCWSLFFQLLNQSIHFKSLCHVAGDNPDLNRELGKS